VINACGETVFDVSIDCQNLPIFLLDIAIVSKLRTSITAEIPNLGRLADAPLSHAMGQRLYKKTPAIANFKTMDALSLYDSLFNPPRKFVWLISKITWSAVMGWLKETHHHFMRYLISAFNLMGLNAFLKNLLVVLRFHWLALASVPVRRLLEQDW
jgi:hypothetical protein